MKTKNNATMFKSIMVVSWFFIPVNIDAAVIQVGKQNEVINYITGSKQILYGLNSAGDDTAGNDSKLMNILLNTATTWELVVDLGKIVWPHQDVHGYPCPTGEFDFSYSLTTSYTKSYSETTEKTVTSSLGLEFQGIGAALENSYSIGTSVGQEKETSETITTAIHPKVQPGGSIEFYRREYWAEYEGTFDWFEDSTGPGGIYHYDDPWSVKILFKSDFEPIPKSGTPCPSVPDVSNSLLLFAMSGLATLGASVKSTRALRKMMSSMVTHGLSMKWFIKSE